MFVCRRDQFPIRDRLGFDVETIGKPPRTAQAVCSWLANGFALLMLLSGCRDHPSAPITASSHGSAMVAIDLSLPANPQALAGGVQIQSPKNAWADFALQLDAAQLPSHPILRLPQFGRGIQLFAYQILPGQVDLNDAQYIRQTGETAGATSLPRALLPLISRGSSVDLSSLRDPSHPADPNLHAQQGPVLIWIDVRVDPAASTGDYSGSCQLLDSRGGESAGSTVVHLGIADVTLPTESHLHFAADLDWKSLSVLEAATFQSIQPRLLRRGDARCSAAIAQLDQCIDLGHENKTDLFVTALQPIVKWPLGKPPEVYWSDFDALIAPWFNGLAFADHQPIGFWPLPEPDSLGQFDLPAQTQFWHQAAEHFDQRMWLDRSPVVLKNQTTGNVNPALAIELSAQARQILSSQPRIGVQLPITQDRIELMSDSNNAGVAPNTAQRIWATAPGLISPSPIRNWSEGTLPPRHWIDGTTSPAGLFNEQSVRLLAWLAFSRDASLVQMGNALPAQPGPASIDALPLVYPPSCYHTSAPLASLSLKWLRSAEQDYECLWLSAQHHDRDAAMTLGGLVTRSLQLQPAQADQRSFDLLAGTTEPGVCEQARQLLVGRLVHHAAATDPIELETLRWQLDRQRPALVPGDVQWMWNLPPDSTSHSPGGSIDSNVNAGNTINATVSVDLFNPGEATALGTQLQWLLPNPAWEADADGVEVPPLARNQARTIQTTARFNLNQLNDQARQPVELRFADGSGNVGCRLMLPVAASCRRDRSIHLDGSLDEWTANDAIVFDQPMVRMLDRRSVQTGDLQMSQQKTSLFSGWSADNLYLAFRLAGVTTADLRFTRNFVEYSRGRAWGEDLCELLIQPIYADNSTGPTLHIVAKPGGEWVEQQSGPDQPWLPFEASGVRYASGVDTGEQVWRGELAIPWHTINASNHGRPALLRFNFIQHIHSTGESASWAGPMDQSRDCKMAGLLVVREN